jgi:molybdate transport system substrate-binding protein
MLKLISSMAMRQVLAELTAAWQKTSGVEVQIESVGGVDAAKRVESGEAFDGVVLASDAIDKLLASGQVVAGSRVDLARSSVAVAVRAGATQPDISTESALRAAIDAAPTIGYSTGPSGTALVKLFERWGISESINSRVVQAPPGVPVGELVARGDVALGFQQLSELMHMEGISVLGGMPEPVSITTIFSAGACTISSQKEAVDRLFAFMASPQAIAVKQGQGMEAA